MDHASHLNPLDEEPSAPVAAAAWRTGSGTADVIAEIWCEVLELPEVGVDDNFFDLGGHSILLQMVHERVILRTAKDVALLDLFNHPTVRSLARHLDDDATDAPAAGAGRRRTSGRVNRLGNRRAQLGENGAEARGEPRE
ncbi:phosphopantetheine-binding protein [Streptomyces sp. YGL11-2]|uniref:phosphopantetheine-binding protein n=1 Tax=Streptomyces sp. YGL11-2 TaxID=3414028 RepID=UPI003CFAACE2